MFKNKIILITGGTGSFGSACVKYLYKNYKNKKLIIFSRDSLNNMKCKILYQEKDMILNFVFL